MEQTKMPSKIPLNEGRTQHDAVSPRFRNDIAGTPAINYCYSCKSEFQTRNVQDLINHYGDNVHVNYSSFCLYCKKGKVHEYRTDDKGLQYYHDCYRSSKNYDK